MDRTEQQTFYRETHVDDASLAFRRFFATNVRLRCPACGRGKVTEGLVGVRSTCAHCGSRFDRMEGNETVSIPLSFFFAVIALLVLALVLVPRYGFFDGLMALLAGAGVVLSLLLLRPTRVMTLWMLWLFGFVYPDRVTEKGRRRLPTRDPATERPAAGSDSGTRGPGTPERA